MGEKGEEVGGWLMLTYVQCTRRYNSTEQQTMPKKWRTRMKNSHAKGGSLTGEGE
jgi:hypothetical protein